MKTNPFSAAIVCLLFLTLCSSRAGLPPAVPVFLIATTTDSTGMNQYFNFNDVPGTHTLTYSTPEGNGTATATITAGNDPLLHTKVILTTFTPGVGSEFVDALAQLDYYFQVNGPAGNVPLKFVGNLNYPNPLPSNANGRIMEASVVLIDAFGSVTNLAYVNNSATPTIKLPTSGVPGGNLNQTLLVTANTTYRFRLSVQTHVQDETSTYEMTMDPKVTIDTAFAAAHPGYTLDFSAGYEPSTNKPDTSRPTLSLTNIPVIGRVSNDTFTVLGQALDNVGVTGVYYNFNHSDFLLAHSDNNFTNWSAALTLTPGTNTLAAYAADPSGNFSLTNIVKLIYVASAPLTVSTNGRGSILPNYNNALLQISNSYALTATPAVGFAFTNWTDGGNIILTNKPTLRFTMASNLVFIANFVDVQKPTFSITNIPVNGKFSNATFIVKGKALDNVGVTNVFLNLNNAGWNGANTGNDFTNWSTNMSLISGMNTIAAYAVDAAGNTSLITTSKVTYIVSAPLTVSTNGRGSILPNYNNALLQISNTYTLTATPGVGFVFTNWTDGGSTIVTNKPTLKFTMASNLVFIANFVDIQKPVLTVMTPTAAAGANKEFFLASGQASDNAAVQSVFYKLNNLDWILLDSTNGFTNWNVTLDLTPGTNVLAAYAVDTSSNVSATNTTKFLYTTAPTSLSGLAAEIAPDGISPFGVAFGTTTFSQFSRDTNNANGVGNYSYTKQSPTNGLLKITYTAPPSATNGGPESIQLSFSAPDTARFTNGVNAGGIRFTSTPTLVPASLLNQTLILVDSQGLGKRTTFTPGKYVSLNLLTGLTNSGTTYSHTVYSPIGALVKVSSTNSVSYFVATFTATNYGTSYEERYSLAGSNTLTDLGVIALTTQRASGNAPTNIVGRSVVLTTDGGANQLFFQDTGFIDVNPLDNPVVNGEGNYSYRRTATNSGNLNLNYTSPVQTAAFEFLFVAPNFAIFTNTADSTLGTAAFK